jgi:CCR4-NOT transcription complex subunit 3
MKSILHFLLSRVTISLSLSSLLLTFISFTPDYTDIFCCSRTQTKQQEMERFKTYEKEAKTKAYSKEGLMSARESAKKEDPKNEIRAWLQKNIDALKIQIDAFEVKLGTSKGSDYDQYAHRLERHHYHLNCLEKILRMWENDQLQKQQIEEIKDSVDYYVEYNQDPDFVEDESIYESFDMKTTELENEPKEDNEASDETSENHKEKLSESNQSTHKEASSSSSSSSSVSVPSSSSLDTSGTHRRNSNTSTVTTPTTTTSVPTSTTTMSTPFHTTAISSSLPSSSDMPLNRRTANERRRSSQPSDSSKGTLTDLPFATVAARAQPQNPSKAVDAHPHGRQPPTRTAQPRSLPVATSTAVTTPSTVSNISTSTIPQLPSEKIVSNVYSSHSSHSSSQVRTLLSSSGSTSTSASASTSTPPPPSLRPAESNPPQLVSNTSTVLSSNIHTSVSTTSSSGPLPSATVTSTLPSTVTTTPVPSLASTSIPTSNLVSSSLILTPTSTPTPSTTTSIPTPTSTSPSTATTTTNLPSTVPTSSNLIGSSVASATVAPSGLSSSTQSSGKTSLSAVPLSQSAMLELSFENIPGLDPLEEDQLEEYQPRNPKPSTPSYFPQTVPSIFDDPILFEKFDIDTLFFIFYYQQGSYQQYLAAKELKRQMWRFHKKYLTWFQREEEPKVITPDYEQGTYVYFDYETGWCQRKKAEFTFEYKYLEDKDLV